MQLLTENHSYKKHGDLQAGHDAFGNKVEPEEGWRLFQHRDRVAIGDKYFDIYSGWQTYLDNYYVGYSGYYKEGGRWTAWAKKIEDNGR